MKIKTLLVVISLLMLPVTSTTAIARQGASPARDWSAVKAVAPGEKLSVRLKDGKKLEGRLRSVSDDLLTLDRSNKTVDLNRGSVERVYRLVKRSAGKAIARSTAIGAGIGFGIGAAVGVWGGSYEDLETAGLVGILGGAGAGIGAGIGAIVGALGSKQKRVLIYDGR